MKKSDELRGYFVQTTPVPNEIYRRVSCVYDVLNQMILDGQLAPFHNGERILASNSIPKQYTLRVVRFLLPSGETKTLVTNLPTHEFTAQNIAQLYFLRWGIETACDSLKNLLAINDISSKTRSTAYQDFYTILAIFDLAAFPSYAADPQITEHRADKHNKYEYKASRYTILAILKLDFPLDPG